MVFIYYQLLLEQDLLPTQCMRKLSEEIMKKLLLVCAVSAAISLTGCANSNNTHEIAKTCREYCGEVHHVQGPGDVRSEWLAAAGTLGLTAGTSTPDSLIDAVESRVHELSNCPIPQMPKGQPVVA